MKRRVAILTPWFGEESTGGAERQARELARRLAQSDGVTVLTTTSRSFMHDWDVDYYRPGRTREGGYDVLRFRVQRRNREAFGAVNAELLALPRECWNQIPSRAETLDAFIDESINSPSLEEHLHRAGQSSYDVVLALPYLYGVVVRGIEASNAAIHLIPCLHDEAYARLLRIEGAFHRARSLLFNSAGEAELALRLYGPGILQKSRIAGEGIAPLERVTSASPISGRYFLYLGRREPEKGIDRLIDAFAHYRSNGERRDVRLALAGAGERSYADAARGIVDLGFVEETTKAALVRGAVALLNPSRNESYSRTLMEAWRENVPVVVDAECLATATAVSACNGGLLAASTGEWTDALRTLDAMDEGERRRLGALGAAYAAENADWDKAIARLRVAVGLDEVSVPARNGKRIDQLLEGADRGDAITDDARGIALRLRALGYDANVYASDIAPGCDAAAKLPSSFAAADALVYHHSIGSDVAERFIAAGGRKALVYHNVTPARYFAPYLPAAAQQLERGREQLARIVAAADVCVGDSDFNANEMLALGGRNVRTIPPLTEFGRLDVSPDANVLRAKRRTTWLFVGRVVPNKGIAALIEAFEAFMALEEDAGLIVLGKFDPADPYYDSLTKSVAMRGIDPYVTFTGYVDDATVVASYRVADVFVCLSEHEGFCVPLLEAMFFDVPVVAKASGAVPGTLGNAGLLLAADAGAYDVAAAVHELCTDRELRDKVVAAQRERRREFTPERVFPLIDAFAADLVPA